MHSLLQALIAITMTYLNKLVAGNKISQDDADRVLGDMKKKCSDIIEKNASSEAGAIEVIIVLLIYHRKS